jgi:hypothetical protein
VWHDVLGHQRRTHDVDLENLPPFFRCCLDTAQHEDGRVIYQDVQSTEDAHRLIDHALNARFVCHIRPYEQSLPALALDMLGERTSSLSVAISDDDCRSLLGEQFARSSADAGPTAGDDGDLVLESIHVLFSVIAPEHP